LKLAEEVAFLKPSNIFDPNMAFDNHKNFIAQVAFENVCFNYPNSNSWGISDISFKINPGEFVALVGPSGAGKSTIVDLLLGILTPDSGNVFISNSPPSRAIEEAPGAVAYVPQEVAIAIGTIRENVGLGFPIAFATNDRINSALEIAHLTQFIQTLEDKSDTQVGERGAKLSGGQRQRLGIARAMFTNPKLLVLDEATSSLDAETEASVSAAIQTLRGGTTILMIAHRLATVRSADLVIYISDGQILAQGSFGEVREAVPDFDKQAKLLGL
jgi:ABC-type multidrug transport system fused ATPase/permease subunit